MEITEVKVFPIQEEKLKAFVSIVFDHCFMVNDIKIIQGKDGLFISMPSRKKKNGEFKDVAHPLNNETRRMIEDKVLGEYDRVARGAGRAGPRAWRRRARERRRAPMASRPRPMPRARRRRRPSRRGRGHAPPRLLLDRVSLPSADERLERARCAAAETGASPSGKAPDFGSGIRRFESSRPNQTE